MPEIISESTDRQSGVLESVLQRTQQLYASSVEEQSDEERIMAGMNSQIIGTMTQLAHQALIEKETRKLSAISLQECWDDERWQQEVTAMKQHITAEMFKEHWFESTLSTPDYPIHAATYGLSMLRYDLRKLMKERPTVDSFRKFGWIMFDVNALRSFKDCTSHQHTTQFLQAIVRILVDPNGPTRRRLQALGISVIPMATGGDEFVLYLRGGEPLTQEIIDETVESFQQEVSSSEELKKYLNFDDPRVHMKYGMPSRIQRQEFAKLSPEARQRRLDEIHAALPDEFIPSFAGGGALLDEGILRAVEQDDRDLQGSDETFTSLREKIVQSMLDLAEARQKKNKEDELLLLATTNTKEHLFRLRGGESRRLQLELQRLEQELLATRRQLEGLLQSAADPRRYLLDVLDAEIGRIPADQPALAEELLAIRQRLQDIFGRLSVAPGDSQIAS
jgi:GGDEF domain-containing protein